VVNIKYYVGNLFGIGNEPLDLLYAFDNKIVTNLIVYNKEMLCC